MKVGIDVRLLSRPLTGIGRYTLEMVKALSCLDGIELYLYSPAPILQEHLPFLDKVTKITCIDWQSGLLRQLWSETLLPYWVSRDEIDVFWGTGHRLPSCLPQGVARVVTIHDLVWKYAPDTMRILSRTLERWQMPKAIRNADYVIADSLATANSIEETFNINPDKLSVIYLGVMAPKFKSKRSLRIELGVDKPYFLFVGTLEPRKNLKRLLEAYADLPESVKSQAGLVIVGGKGWGGIDLPQLIDQLNLVDRVKLLGYVDDETLNELYANALFLAMPSIYEGFGLPLLEAMVHGTPVLTSQSSSMPEVTGNAGLLIDPTDVSSIRHGLTKMIVDNDFRNQLADNTNLNASRFSWNDAANQIYDIFKSAIANRKQELV